MTWKQTVDLIVLPNVTEKKVNFRWEGRLEIVKLNDHSGGGCLTCVLTAEGPDVGYITHPQGALLEGNLDSGGQRYWGLFIPVSLQFFKVNKIKKFLLLHIFKVLEKAEWMVC